MCDIDEVIILPRHTVFSQGRKRRCSGGIIVDLLASAVEAAVAAAAVAISTLPTGDVRLFRYLVTCYAEEGSNDVTIFRFSRYLHVGAGLVVGQMSVSQDQYFLIFFFPSSVLIFLQSTLLRVNRSHNPVVPLNYFPLIVI